MTGRIEEYRGREITLRIEGGRCIHSRRCVLGRPDVFVPNVEGAWVHPDAAPAEAVAALAKACPSGAISYRRNDGGAEEAPPAVNTVHVRENGPLAVHADLEVGGDLSTYRATLCRCGRSRNKPYCDNSHHEADFHATGEPDTRPSEPLARRDGRLSVTPARDGPLMLSGPVEVCSGTGRTVSRETRVALCRCGASANKPFCDGSHARVGFRAD